MCMSMCQVCRVLSAMRALFCAHFHKFFFCCPCAFQSVAACLPAGLPGFSCTAPIVAPNGTCVEPLPLTTNSALSLSVCLSPSVSVSLTQFIYGQTRTLITEQTSLMRRFPAQTKMRRYHPLYALYLSLSLCVCARLLAALSASVTRVCVLCSQAEVAFAELGPLAAVVANRSQFPGFPPINLVYRDVSPAGLFPAACSKPDWAHPDAPGYAIAFLVYLYAFLSLTLSLSRLSAPLSLSLSVLVFVCHCFC